jgi:hypothetical protein
VIFFDASAAAKRYFGEIGSDRVEELWTGPEFLSSLAISSLRARLSAHSKASRAGPALGGLPHP